jgi:MoaA/NifB/PqqE/SkfB family radical SAM enzyme
MDNNADNGGKELNIEEIRKISYSLGRFSRLFISGGEPFLRDDIAEICEIFYLQNKIRSIHLPTNGFYTDRIYNYAYNILQKCPEVRLTVGISLDGLEETHERIKGIKGSFEKAVETTKRLSALKEEFDNLNIYIITVVNNMNLKEITRLSEFVKNNLPVDGHGPSPMRGTSYDKALSPPAPEEWDELSKELIKYHSYWNKKRAASGFKAFLATNRTRYLHKTYTAVLKGKKLPFKCLAGTIIGVLEPDGDVKLCELTDAVGNVRSANYDFRTILLSGRAREMKKKIKDCACTHTCFLGPSINMNLLCMSRAYLSGRL